MRAPALVVALVVVTGCGKGPLEGTWQLTGTLKDTAPGGAALMLPKGNFVLAQPDLDTVKLATFGCELEFVFDGTEDYRLSPRSQTCITTEPISLAFAEPIAPPLFVRLESGNIHALGGAMQLQLFALVHGREVQIDASGFRP